MIKVFMLALCCTPVLLGQAVIEDTGSTNRQGITVTIGDQGHAMIANKHGLASTMIVKSELHKKFLHDLQLASPLDKLPVMHCMKSASFGSSTYVTYKGRRSPDLSCPSPGDPRVTALQEDLNEILSHTRNISPMQLQGPR